MELLSTVKYPLFFPFWVLEHTPGDFYNDVECALPTLMFRLKHSYSIEEQGFRSINSYNYYCESCLAYTGDDWKTSEFKKYESKEIPNFIEEEMLQHVKDHQSLGAWGILWSKKNKLGEKKC